MVKCTSVTTMFSLRLLILFVASSSIRTTILEDVGQADLEAIRIRLEEEKAKRLLLQNDVEVLMLQFEELKRNCDKRDSLAFQGKVTSDTPTIAFTATLSLTSEFVSEQTVIFDNVKINEGNCYNSSTGKFSAPFRGLYSFSVSVFKTHHSMVHSIVMKDNIEIGKVFSGSASWGSGSVTLVTVMDQGQVVYVKEYPGKTETWLGDHWATLTGLLQTRYD